MTTTANCGACGRVCPASTDPCLVAACLDGACGFVPNTDGTPCDDGNACTQTDTCQSGTCVGNNPVVCAASDQCHDVGVCDPATGQCSNPPKPNGTSCSDNNACTDTDTCQQGICTPGTAVVCHPLDQCHVAGVCNPASGQCSNPPNRRGASAAPGLVLRRHAARPGRLRCERSLRRRREQHLRSLRLWHDVLPDDLRHRQRLRRYRPLRRRGLHRRPGERAAVRRAQRLPERDLQRHEQHLLRQSCGAGVACVGAGSTCDDPTCGGPGQACCAGNACDSGACSRNTSVRAVRRPVRRSAVSTAAMSPTATAALVCPDGACWPVECGGPNEACCDGTRCQNGLVCERVSVCRLAVRREEPACCAGGTCNGGRHVHRPDLQPCGGLNESCCPATSAAPGSIAGHRSPATGTTVRRRLRRRRRNLLPGKRDRRLRRRIRVQFPRPMRCRWLWQPGPRSAASFASATGHRAASTTICEPCGRVESTLLLRRRPILQRRLGLPRSHVRSPNVGRADRGLLRRRADRCAAPESQGYP